MGKRKTKARNQQIYDTLLDMGQPNSEDDDGENDDGEESTPGGTRNQMKKFRFQLLHEWLVNAMEPCSAADIGGGKGLLAYLLGKSGWKATVIDPVHQELPNKYKDLRANKRVMIPAGTKVSRIDRRFAPAAAAQFDLLIGLHAHGCNVQIIDACATYNSGFVLLPCCVIDEPLFPVHGVTWVQSLTDYAIRQGFEVKPFRLGFSGQNIGIYAPKRA